MSNEVITEEQIYREVRKAVAETLRVEDDSIQPNHSFTGDLGAESLDFIDINYRLEQSFRISMPRKSLVEHMEELFGEATAIDDSGQITDTAVLVLKARLGEGAQGVQSGMLVEDIQTLITPQTFVEIVKEILGSCPETCTSCGAANWTAADNTIITCGECGKPASLANGDDLIQSWLEEFKEKGFGVGARE
jgi:acyl carrier protein